MTPLNVKALAEKIPCWGDGIAGPKECDESYSCELHYRLAEVVKEARAAAYRDASHSISCAFRNIYDGCDDHAKECYLAMKRALDRKAEGGS